MDIKNKYLLKFILFFPLIIYLGKRSLVAFDEGFYAIQSRNILNTNNWIGPMWFDQLSTDRTIGIQSLLAISQKIFGESLFALYLPITLSAIFILFCTYYLHKELIKDKNQIASTIILSTTFLWITYAHMATQDIVYSAMIALGLISSIKSYKTNNIFFLILSGSWIGLAVMLKTYLTVIPLIAIFPFLLKSKIIQNKYFWLGTFLGFLPFIFWSYKFISIYSFSSYSGLYKKLLTLSNENSFSHPFYYYIWNLSINIFPWTLISPIGFLESFKMNNISRYFLFIYPLLVISLLSIFSTKTPYYPLQIMPLISINSYLGIKVITNKINNKFISIIKFSNFLLIPLIIIFGIIIINNSSILNLESHLIKFITIGGLLFSIPWIGFIYFKRRNRKLFLSILGPYFLIMILVQSGLLTDKSKQLRIASENIIKEESLSNKKIEVISSDVVDDNSFSKIIKIMIKMPTLAEGIKSIDKIKSNEYFWTTKDLKNIKDSDNFEILSNNEIFEPWKLLRKK